MVVWLYDLGGGGVVQVLSFECGTVRPFAAQRSTVLRVISVPHLVYGAPRIVLGGIISLSSIYVL